MTTETVPNPVAVQKPSDMSETAERSIDGEWTRSDSVSESVNPGCLAFCSEDIRQEGKLDLIGLSRAVRACGLRCAIVSSRPNIREVPAAAGIEDLFEHVVEGVAAERTQLGRTSALDAFLAAARALAVEPRQAVVFTGAPAGVEAERAGGFGHVVGVDRGGRRDALRAHGADVVVGDLSELFTPP